MTNFISALDPKQYDRAPLTWSLTSKYEVKRLQEYISSHKKASFIVKPNAGCQGDGMMIFKDLKDLHVSIDNADVVIQRYLDKPLIIDELKFDLRIYIVVVGIDQPKAYICDEGLARFCTVSKCI